MQNQLSIKLREKIRNWLDIGDSETRESLEKLLERSKSDMDFWHR